MPRLRRNAAVKVGALAVLASVTTTGCGGGSDKAGYFQVPNASPYYGVAVLEGGTEAKVLLCRPVDTSTPRPDLLVGATPDGYDDPEKPPHHLLEDITNDVTTGPGDVTRTDGVDGLPDQTCDASEVSSDGWVPFDSDVEGVIVGNGAADRGAQRTLADIMVLFPGTQAAAYRLAFPQYDKSSELAGSVSDACAKLASAVSTRTGNSKLNLPKPCNNAVPSGPPTKTGPMR